MVSYRRTFPQLLRKISERFGLMGANKAVLPNQLPSRTSMCSAGAFPMATELKAEVKLLIGEHTGA